MDDIISNLVADFERDCDAVGVKPHAVLKAAGVHSSLWWKWRGRDRYGNPKKSFAPSMKNFELVRRKLDEIRSQRVAA